MPIDPIVLVIFAVIAWLALTPMITFLVLIFTWAAKRRAGDSERRRSMAQSAAAGFTFRERADIA